MWDKNYVEFTDTPGLLALLGDNDTLNDQNRQRLSPSSVNSLDPDGVHVLLSRMAVAGDVVRCIWLAKFTNMSGGYPVSMDNNVAALQKYTFLRHIRALPLDFWDNPRRSVWLRANPLTAACTGGSGANNSGD